MINIIYNALKDIIDQEEYIRLHMPGHKGRKTKNIDWYKYDFTEIPGSDNLSNPDGPLLEVMDEIANIYGARKSFLLINGSTVGIIASILTTCMPGDSFVVPRNSHRSVYSALLLHDIDPIYIYPQTEKQADRSWRYPVIKPNQVEKAFVENPKCKGIIITSPTYEGVCIDVKSISEIAVKYKKILIVDEAHGAHLRFNKDFPTSSVELGADIVVQSTHKILGSFNQGALLHLCSSKIDSIGLRNNLNMLQTSSPSYPIMISIEHAVKDAYENGNSKMNNLFRYYDYVESEIKGTIFHLKGTELLETGMIFDYDKSKLWICTKQVSGNDLSKILRKGYGIQVEMSDEHGILAMMGMGTVDKDVRKLVEALKIISNQYREKEVKFVNTPIYPKVNKVMSPYETLTYKTETISLFKSKGRISAGMIIPYPPGIPILAPGEMIDYDILEYISKCNKEDVVGLIENEKIVVIK